MAAPTKIIVEKQNLRSFCRILKAEAVKYCIICDETNARSAVNFMKVIKSYWAQPI
jgi:hypothetical protein